MALFDRTQTPGERLFASLSIGIALASVLSVTLYELRPVANAIDDRWTDGVANIIPSGRDIHEWGEDRDLQSQLDRAVKSLEKGVLVVHGPSEMKVDDTKPVFVRIARAGVQNIQENLPKEGKTETNRVSVSSFMSVRLEGDEGLVVKPFSPEKQFLSGNEFTEWSYEIHAVQTGEQTLKLEVGVRIKLPGGEEQRFAPVFRKKITVNVSTWGAIELFAKKHWLAIVSSIAGSIAIPVLLAFFTAWMKRREDEKTKKESSVIVPPTDADFKKIVRPGDD